MTTTFEEPDDLAFMRDPGLWPWWPMLPLKEGHWEGRKRRHGYLVERGMSGTFDLYEGLMFEHKSGKQPARAGMTKEDLSDLIDAGWIVD